MDNATLNAEKALPTVTYREVKTEAPKTEPKVETPAEEVKVEETKTEDK
jgi:hypothetical protein